MVVDLFHYCGECCPLGCCVYYLYYFRGNWSLGCEQNSWLGLGYYQFCLVDRYWTCRHIDLGCAIVVPSKFIQQDADGNNYLFIVENGSTAKKVKVITGMSYQGNTLIKSGLKGDEEIVLEGARSIKDGETVEITK